MTIKNIGRALKNIGRAIRLLFNSNNRIWLPRTFCIKNFLKVPKEIMSKILKENYASASSATRPQIIQFYI